MFSLTKIRHLNVKYIFWDQNWGSYSTKWSEHMGSAIKEHGCMDPFPVCRKTQNENDIVVTC